VRAHAHIAFVAALWIASLAPQSGGAQPPDAGQATERTIKAAYLYKFAGYVEWPGGTPGEDMPLTIGVLESPAMADELVRITTGRMLNERTVDVRHVAAGDPLQGLHILFVGARDRKRIDELLQPAQAMPILIVTEAAGALAAGSIINFTIDRQRVRFEVSLPAAERNRLKLSSRLLAVAQRVERMPGK